MLFQIVLAPLLAVSAVSSVLPEPAAVAQGEIAPLDPPMTLAERTALRCSAAFSLVAGRQQSGDPAAREFPPLSERGREFFVRTAAGIMDSRGWNRQQVAMLMQAEGRSLVAEKSDLAIMPGCLSLLESSGL